MFKLITNIALLQGVVHSAWFGGSTSDPDPTEDTAASEMVTQEDVDNADIMDDSTEIFSYNDEETEN